MVEAIVNLPNDPLLCSALMTLLIPVTLSAVWGLLIRRRHSEAFPNPCFVYSKKINESSAQTHIIAHHLVAKWLSRYIKRKDKPSAEDDGDHISSSLHL
ncbi:hypothetical protein JOD45_000811 [Scopulibacillus daqui]|uniref:Uncharacterized protein n=1 Tax=Scopulibacillus daqui TaxID=1469162 RepID=A0ABS2PXC2_9BACL|nr:hypothetical protein [Scopulibacillus daqui]MBM7644618.1 hypothetical protein [Scopulibacillus daqui]